MDDYIKNYINQALSCDNLTDDEIRESLCYFIEDTNKIEELIKQRIINKPKHVIENLKINKNIEIKKPCIPRTDVDPELKKKIVNGYSYVSDTNINSVVPHIPMNNEPNRKIRYRNDLIVTSKGDKYIEIV